MNAGSGAVRDRRAITRVLIPIFFASGLMATFPPGYTGDPTAEHDRRPGSDT